MLSTRSEYHIVWLFISELELLLIKDCEIMAKLVRNSMLLKVIDYRLQMLTYIHKVCIAWTLAACNITTLHHCKCK